MKADLNSSTGRIGVAAMMLMFERLGWIFRDQPIADYGIDAHVEIKEDDKATGKLIALQIKSGESWFKTKENGGIVFYCDAKHLEYWHNHSLPVMVVLYSDIEQTAYWQIVNNNTVKKNKKGWKIIIPFKQKVDASSLDKIKEFSKKIVPTNGYTIFSLRDVSHSNAKRYAANILVNKEYSQPEIREIIAIIIAELKTREYYRNDKVKQYWNKKETQVISLFLYLSLDDISAVNWICRVQWISNKLPPKFSPVKIDGEQIDNEIIIDWNKDYEKDSTFFDFYKLTKEDYLDKMHSILNKTKIVIDKIIKFTNIFDETIQLTHGLALEQKQQIEDMRLAKISPLEPEMTELYSQATELGLAPTECSDLSQQFQRTMAMAHNIVLPFSKRGLETWEEKSRNYLVKQAIKDYMKDLQRLEFEIEKVYS
jgi:hypothetical protein